MSNYIKSFSNNTPVLVNGKAVLYEVHYEAIRNRMDLARKILGTYPDHFSETWEVVRMLKAYESTGDLVIGTHTAYILHQA